MCMQLSKNCTIGDLRDFFKTAGVGSLITDLAAGGACVVLVEQNLPLVRAISTRVGLMNNGRLEATVQTLGTREAEQYLGV